MLGQTENPKVHDSTKTMPHALVGAANEVPATIDHVDCTALVDTGSQVSTVARTFYDTYLSHIELHDCMNLLRVEGAGGDSIPYLGYIIVDLCLEGITSVTAPVLVVTDTNYNRRVPLIIGTNYLGIANCCPGMKIRQTVKMAKQSVDLVQKHLQQSHGVYGTIHAAETLTVEPGHVRVFCGNVCINVPVAQTVAMIAAPSDVRLEVTPSLINLHNSTATSYVEIANMSDTHLIINKGEKIADLHQVAVVSHIDSPGADDTFLNDFDLGYLEKNVSREEFNEVKQMLLRWKHIFSKDSMDLGKTSVLKHRIDLQENIPIKERARRIPPNLIDELRDHIQQLHNMGVIEESVSPWSSPIVLVRKKSGELRMCVDYRKLNAKTIKDSYRIPTIEELIDTLGGATWFATLDLSSGYHQVMIEETDKEKTAFTAGPLGFWQYTRMPFGLCNAPALFQRMMERVLSGIHLKTALVYLDDIIVFGNSASQLKTRLEVVFKKIHAAGLKLKAKKCSLFHQTLKVSGAHCVA